MRETNCLDQEWIELIIEAREVGLNIEEISNFLKLSQGLNIRNESDLLGIK